VNVVLIRQINVGGLNISKAAHLITIEQSNGLEMGQFFSRRVQEQPQGELHPFAIMMEQRQRALCL
jgi:hypothetical protein